MQRFLFFFYLCKIIKGDTNKMASLLCAGTKYCTCKSLTIGTYSVPYKRAAIKYIPYVKIYLLIPLHSVPYKRAAIKYIPYVKIYLLLPLRTFGGGANNIGPPSARYICLTVGRLVAALQNRRWATDSFCHRATVGNIEGR